ncbi:MAG: type II toxin-antitoxin system HicA family toxin [Bryobacterales bacterium]|nr:type II toxin-antitoxin system HicA family toxin [Bryobacterales bacterium]
MGRLRVLSGSEVCEILEQHDFVAVRHRGSHRIMQRQVDGTTITVPVPLHDPVRRGTLLSIIRQSGLAKSLFETA